MTEQELKEVANVVANKTIFCTKEVLTFAETAQYMGMSKSYLYKLTMRREIPHYKPSGKMCYFNRVEVEQWLQSNRVSTMPEIDKKASKHCFLSDKSNN
jgi:DNA binding domain, excisionase family